MKIDIEHAVENDNNCILLGRVSSVVPIGITVVLVILSMAMQSAGFAGDVVGGTTGAWIIFLFYDFYRKKQNATYNLVTLNVKFSEEESQLIKDNGLEDTVVMDLSHDDYGLMQGDAEIFGDANVKIGSLMRYPVNRRYIKLTDAKQFESSIHEALPKLKDYIMKHEGGVEQKQSFEL